MAADLKKRSSRAQKQVNLTTRFMRNQERARRIFYSTPFQCLVVCLIFTVSPLIRLLSFSPTLLQHLIPYQPATHQFPFSHPKSHPHHILCPSFSSQAQPNSDTPSPTRPRSLQNFVINAAQAQLNGQLLADNGSLSEVGSLLDRLDVAFTCVFAAELIFNAFAHWFTPFITNQYNIIDSVVIMLSLVSLGPLDIPVSILRVVRAFRVIRIFGRLSNLKNIINALTASLIPVFNSFLLILVFMSICAPPKSSSCSVLQ
jgi:hypothetical protein